MRRHMRLAFILLAIPLIFSEEHRYCRLPSCPNRTHTLCKYPDPEPVSRCGNSTETRLSIDEQSLILNIYNANRPLITLHEERKNSDPQPTQPGTTINFRIFWDNELERIAQRWANQCINMVDECRNIERFDVRQRVGFARTRHADENLVNTLVTRWILEDRFPHLNSLHFQGLSTEEAVISASNLFTQLMRLSENRIGCGAVRPLDDNYESIYLVCNYGIHQ